MRYRWNGEHFVDRATGKPMPQPAGDAVTRPAIWSDVEYMSPMSRRMVTSRSQRRDEMKRYGVREVDPSEHTPVYTNREDAAAHRADWEAPPPPPSDDGIYKRLSRDELPARLRKSTAK